MNALQTILNPTISRAFRLGEVLIPPGQMPEGVILVKSGRVRIIARPSGEAAPVTLGIVEAPADIGAISLALGRPMETAVASTEGEYLFYPAAQFLQAFQEKASVREAVLNRTLPAEIFALLEADYVRNARSCKTLHQATRKAMETAVVSLEGPGKEDLLWLNAAKESFGTLATSGTTGRVVGLRLGSETKLEQWQAPPQEVIVPVLVDSGKEEPISVEDLMETATRICGVEFIREPVRRYLARFKNTNLRQAASAARITGLDSTFLTLDPPELPKINLPALAFFEGRICLLTGRRKDGFEILQAPGGKREVRIADLVEPGETLDVAMLSAMSLDPTEKFSIKKLLPIVKEHKRALIEVFVASLFVQLFALANPLITQVVIDKVLVQNSPHTLNVLGTLLVVVALAGAVLGAIRTFLFTDTTNRIDLKLGGQIIDHLYRLTLSYFQKRPVGEISSRVHELENIRQFLTGTALTIVLDALFSVIYIAVMLIYSIPLTIAALLALPLLAGITFAVSPLYRRQLRTRAQHYASSQSHLVETLTGAQTVKAQNLEQHSLWEWQKRYSSYVAAGFRAILTSTSTGAVTGFLSKLSDLAVLWYGAWLVIDGKLTLGQLIAFRIIAGYVTSPMLRLVQSWQSFQEVGLSIERLGDVLDSPLEQSSADNSRIPLPKITGEVTFEGITFQYQPDRAPQLRNVSFQVPPGSLVGVVGLSGSGKSTLVKLIPRLQTPNSGRILIDDYDIAKVELYSLRNQIATVLQDTILFNISIRENIALSRPEATADEIIEAARVACAHEFIMNLPEGYETKAGEQGRAVSGGQRQRISIARAILQSPRMLVLDEATSALDFPTERQVCRNLRQAFPDVTIFFVTHRLPSIEKADHILVLENGVIVEQGNHAQLTSLNGTYANLHRKQEASFE